MLTNEFIKNVCKKIKYKPIREDISYEIKNHIDEKKENYINQGMNEKMAEEKAVEQMGDAEILGNNLNKIHKPKLDWKMLILIVILLMFGSLVANIRVTNDVMTNVYNISTSGIGKYIFALGIGIIASTLIYFMDYRKIFKYSMPIYILATLIILMSRTVLNGVRYIEIFRNNILPQVLSMPLYIIAFAGFINKLYNKNNLVIKTKKGKRIQINININTIKLVILSIISILLFLMINSATSAFIISLVYLIIATINIYKKSRNRAKKIAILWGIPIAILCILGFASCSNGFMKNRIIRMFSGLQPEIDANGYGLETLKVREIINSSKLFGKTDMEEFNKLHFNEGTRYAFVSLLGNYGWIISMGMVISVIFLCIKLIENAISIKEEYGKFIIIGISSLFILESLFNLAMNLGFGIIANFNIPLVSYGLSSLIVNMMCLALVMSIYRRKNIIFSNNIKTRSNLSRLILKIYKKARKSNILEQKI